MIRWPWRRTKRRRQWQTPSRIPDGDTVPIEGYARWADLLETADPLHEPTRMLRPLRVPPWAS